MEELQERTEEAQLEAMKALVGDMPANMAFSNGVRPKSTDEDPEMARDAQREAATDFVSVLLKQMAKGKAKFLQVILAPVEATLPQKVPVEPTVDKDKGVVVMNFDDDYWGDDEVLSGCESDQHHGRIRVMYLVVLCEPLRTFICVTDIFGIVISLIALIHFC